MENEQVIRELTEFATTTGRTMQNHRDQLQRHEEILHAEYKAGETHRDAIQDLRTSVQTLGQQISTLQHSVIEILKAMGLPTPEDEPPGQIN